MKKINKIISSVAAVAIMSSAATAAKISDKGNYLVTPAYFATQSGYSTNFKVYNTNIEKAVVAKVVVREAACSQELKDFLIFLSPGDAFSADIKVVDGNVKIFTTDDSADTGTVVNDLTKGLDKTAAAYLKDGLDLLPGSIFAPARLNTNDVGTKLTSLDIYNGNEKVTKFSANAGYVEVFTLLEIDAKSLDSSWAVRKPLSKSKMVAFYDDVTKALIKEGVNYGTRDSNFTNYVPKNNADYEAIIKKIDEETATTSFANSVGKKYDIKAILNGSYIGNIDENLLTGTVTIKNTAEGSEAAMTTPLYTQNIVGLTNRVFGERQVETNYVRVLNGDVTAANNALKSLVDATSANSVYIPYTKGKPSLLNTLFLAKNLSNKKCVYKKSGSKVIGVERMPVAYTSDIRNMKEDVFAIISKENPFSGYYIDKAETSSLYPELAQLHVKKIIDKTPEGKFNQGWITLNITDKFDYDVDEKKTNNYFIKQVKPSILPSYMQVIGTSAEKTYTNMYRPAVD